MAKQIKNEVSTKKSKHKFKWVLYARKLRNKHII